VELEEQKLGGDVPHAALRLLIASLIHLREPRLCSLLDRLFRIHWTELRIAHIVFSSREHEEEAMGFGRGALLWLLGIPLPIILLLALFWHH
jgi:hypothetical protein